MSAFNERILNGISVFAAIVDAGTFAAAGDRLGMSQPGVSRAIARLEARLKIRLFDRTTRSVSLTDDGPVSSNTSCRISRDWRKPRPPHRRVQRPCAAACA